LLFDTLSAYPVLCFRKVLDTNSENVLLGDGIRNIPQKVKLSTSRFDAKHYIPKRIINTSRGFRF